MAKDNEETLPFRVAGRYEARELLGRGGMASVYKAWDETLGTFVALKLLTLETDGKRPARAIELFEREFHTLVQLSHPRIVRALDYGVEGDQPYYALELLDGGDLRELSPLRWQDVCNVAYEICSALSLLHSRGLVHRDLTPRNVRRTESGQSKLIDFGLLSPMGPTTLLAGTAPFVPPELVRSMSLDGRSDLFSLGATLYYALTKRQPYPARSFEQLQDAWRSSPARPSSVVAGVPSALDDLILGMLRVDAGSRPKSAAEVMERLAPLLSSPPDGELRAARAYLVTPKLTGRDHVVAQFRKRMMQAVRGHGGGFIVSGAEGTGRSRMVDAFVLEAKLVGATAIRAGRDDATRPFGVATSLAQQIHRAAPGVALAAAAANPNVSSVLYPGTSGAPGLDAGPIDVTRAELGRAELQAALRAWILEFSARRPLAIAIDNLDRIDEPSAALLASLSWEAAKRRLTYLAVSPPRGVGSASKALEILRKHSEEVELAPLSTPEVTTLVASLFGEVPHLDVLSVRIAALSSGRPRECMVFAQYLVDAGAITYAGGSWMLPAAIPDELLPDDLDAAFALRVAQLGPLARHVAALLAEDLLGRLSRAELLSVELAPASRLDAAMDELTAARIIAGDSSGYSLTGQAMTRTLVSSLDESEKRKIHDQLSLIHERAARHTLLVAHHSLKGSRAEEALARIASETPDTDARTGFILAAAEVMGEDQMGIALDLATRTAERLGRSRAELQSLRGMLAGISARGATPAHFYRIADTWLSQAKHDSGYDDWRALDAALDPSVRAMMAVSAAVQRHGETPAADRGQSPQEGIQQLVAYVLFAIAISARVNDRDLQATLPGLLVPFAPLNPMIAAVAMNARATRLFADGRQEDAQAAFRKVLEQLESVSGAELRYVENVRAAVCYALATIDTTLGIPSVLLSRLTELQDRNQRVSALFLQKVAALQQGDWELAEKYRREGELLSLQASATSMFSTLGDEIEIYAMARDLTGVRHLRAAVRAMAEKFSGWVPMQRVADAHYLRLCGDLEGAFTALGPLLDGREDGALHGRWSTAGRVLAVQLLTDLGRAEEALWLGRSELGCCEAHGMRQQARNLSLAMALAEAKLGRREEAARRAQTVISEQVRLGVTGVQLGYSYEARARIAMAANDGEAFHRFASLAWEQYRPGKSSVFGALYERLMDDARQAGLVEAAPVAAQAASAEGTRRSEDLTDLIAACDNPRERAECALGLLCDGDPPTRGHLLVATENGFALVASNTPCASVSEIVTFASDCVEREKFANEMETAALASVSLGTMSAEWRDAEGTDYEVVLLMTNVSQVPCIGGVALLVRHGPPRASNLGALAESIARALITSGDAITVAAA